MKRILLFAILALLGMSQAVAQEYEYVPFVREGVKWVYYYINEDTPLNPAKPYLGYGKVSLTLEIRGDTSINGIVYKAMHKYYGNTINEVNDTVPVYLRENNKVVYGIVPNGQRYADCPIGNLFADNGLQDIIYEGKEFVLYDFQDPETYWDNLINVYDDDNMNEYNSLYTDTITAGNHSLIRYVGTLWSTEFYTIEGIGVDTPRPGYTLFPIMSTTMPGSTQFMLSHVVEDGRIIYKGIHYDPDNMTGIDEVVADKGQRAYDGTYYNLMGQPVGKEVPTTPGIYIHNGNKILVR